MRGSTTEDAVEEDGEVESKAGLSEAEGSVVPEDEGGGSLNVGGTFGVKKEADVGLPTHLLALRNPCEGEIERVEKVEVEATGRDG